jgi:hypothetical protein
MKKKSTLLSVLFATALGATHFSYVPAAHAISDVRVTADDYNPGEDTEYTIKFTLDEDFDAGDTIYVEFDSDFDIDDLDTSDVEVDGHEPEDVYVDDNVVEITVDEDYSEGDTIRVTIDGITNPDDEDDYDVYVYTDNDDDDDYDTVTISEDDDDDNDGDTIEDAFDVTVTSPYEGDISGYVLHEFDLARKSDELSEGDEVVVTFPNADMLPDDSDVDKEDVAINGHDVKNISISGKEVILGIPKGADGDDYLEIEFFKGFGIENPDHDTDYTVKVEYDNYEYVSNPFEIKKPVQSTDFPVLLSSSKAGARSSYTFEASFGSSQIRAGKQLKIEFPSADMIPSSLSRYNITINGKQVRSVKVSGKTVTLTASTTQQASRNVKVIFSYNANIKNPRTAGNYTLKMSLDSKTITSKPFTITQ